MFQLYRQGKTIQRCLFQIRQQDLPRQLAAPAVAPTPPGGALASEHRIRKCALRETKEHSFARYSLRLPQLHALVARRITIAPLEICHHDRHFFVVFDRQ